MSTSNNEIKVDEITTAGIQLKTSRRWLADAVELLSSMRFAISLLTIIAIASVIGTVLKQKPEKNRRFTRGETVDLIIARY